MTAALNLAALTDEPASAAERAAHPREHGRTYRTPGYYFPPRTETLTDRVIRMRADSACFTRQLRTLAEGPEG